MQSGRMYYLNRKSLKKSWTRPRVQSVNLDLNMSTTAATDMTATAVPSETEPKRSGGNMVARCTNCHLLVMLSKSSPACPNCKFVQPLAPATSPQPLMVARRRLDTAVKPLETLSLLH
jgi:hypothetical protein